MNDHDVISRLRTALDDVHHERTLHEVARRARVLRARRRAPGVVAAALAVAGAITVGVAATAPSSFADWTSEPQVADPAVAAVIDASCRTMMAPEGGADDELLLLDVRGQHAVAVYRDEAGGVWSCSRFQGGGRPGDVSWWNQGGGGGAGPLPEATQQQPIVLEAAGTSYNANAGEMTWVVGRALSEAERVEVRVPGSTVTAAQSDGYFEAWWPTIAAEPGRATVTAYDDDGGVLATTTTEVYGFGR